MLVGIFEEVFDSRERAHGSGRRRKRACLRLVSLRHYAPPDHVVRKVEARKLVEVRQDAGLVDEAAPGRDVLPDSHHNAGAVAQLVHRLY
eukprot:CAMPEP_0198233636 /NCGR_PEP_ID=MMETSP1445-20131203/116341_1 /TAXON_ID=36898 /ORGANISM="Pyramimonas sp., Strain CCMP2087" /LENGTH=89 /DNA_ID=CAMNT_0043914335 /DNA_START=261 /DNA_END=530 /DNA_ORIENTATION=+